MCIKVMIANSGWLVRFGMRAEIERMDAGITVVGEAVDGQEVLACMTQEQMRGVVIVLGTVFPDMTGLAIARRLLKNDRAARIILVNDRFGRNGVRGAIRLGVLGYLTLQSDIKELLAAVRQVSVGEHYISPLAHVDPAGRPDGFQARHWKSKRLPAAVRETPRETGIPMVSCFRM